jgi:hypothetical protein
MRLYLKPWRQRLLDVFRAVREVFPIESTWAFVVVAALIGAVLVGGLAYAVDQGHRKATTTDVTLVANSKLRLQFFGDNRIPTEIAADNIASWFTGWSPSFVMTELDAQNQPRGSTVLPKTWFIFIAFDKPASFRQIVVSFSSPGFPPYEVKQQNNRVVVVMASGEIPAGSLEIYAKP